MHSNKKIFIWILIIAAILFVVWLVWKNRNKIGSKAPHGGGGGGGGHFSGSGFSGHTGGGFSGHVGSGFSGHVGSNFHSGNRFSPATGHTLSHINPHVNSHFNNRVHFRQRPAHFTRFISFPLLYSLYYPLYYDIDYPAIYETNNSDLSYDHTIDESEELWSNHVKLTRQYIQLAVRNSAVNDIKSATENLLQNATDFGRFYNSPELNILIKNHLLIAIDITNSLLKNGTPDATLVKKWQKNARQLAKAFANLTDVSDGLALGMLNRHLSLTTDELLAEYNCVKNNMAADCEKSSNVFLQIQDQAKEMADKFFY